MNTANDQWWCIPLHVILDWHGFHRGSFCCRCLSVLSNFDSNESTCVRLQRCWNKSCTCAGVQEGGHSCWQKPWTKHGQSIGKPRRIKRNRIAESFVLKSKQYTARVGILQDQQPAPLKSWSNQAILMLILRLQHSTHEHVTRGSSRATRKTKTISDNFWWRIRKTLPWSAPFRQLLLSAAPSGKGWDPGSPTEISFQVSRTSQQACRLVKSFSRPEKRA